MNIGIQTFTIRKAQKKSITKAYMPLIRLGIRSFEVARIKFNKKNALEIKSLVDEHGIEISAIQVKPHDVIENKDSVVDFCRTVGCKRVIISMLPFRCILGREKVFYDFLSTLDPLYESYSAEGITLGYHHHNWEYMTLSSKKTRMEELLSKTEKIKFVSDTYWSAKSGVLPAKQLRDFSKRLLGVHLRDITVYRKGLSMPTRNSTIGEGFIDFEETLAAAMDAGCEYLVIEEKTKTPYESIEKSYGYLNSLNEKK